MSNTKDFKVKNGIKPTVYHEAVGTVVSGSEAYSLANASYDGVSFGYSAQDNDARGATFKSDGTAFYLAGSNVDTIFQYTLSTAWDLSTASYASKSFVVSSQDLTPIGVKFKPDGTKMYLVGQTNDRVYQYSLSTAWDISTASYDSINLSVSAQDTNPFGLFFKPDGTKMYISGNVNDSVYQYSLSTAWDISTATYDSVSFSVTSQDTANAGLFFTPDGSKMFVVGIANDSIFEYSLGSAWDISTASYSGNSYVTTEASSPVWVEFNGDGTKMYVNGFSPENTIYQYSTALNTATLDLSTGSVFELTPTSDIQVSLSNPAVSGTVSGATLLLEGAASSTYDMSAIVATGKTFTPSQGSTLYHMSFNNDGTSAYVYRQSDITLYQYSLSTPYDITTATYASKSFDVSANTSGVWQFVFKPDGTKLFATDNSGSQIDEYVLSTAWDISTLSYSTTVLVTASPYGFSFSSDGTKLVVGNGASVQRFNLSTAWSVDTASSLGTTTFAEDTQPGFVYFNSNGTKFFMLGFQNNTKFYQYSLSTPWDVSTRTYDSVVYTFSSFPGPIYIKDDGTKLYTTDYTTYSEYLFSTPATITYDTAIQWAGGTAPTSPAIGETDVLTFTTRDGGTSYSAALAIDGAQ